METVRHTLLDSHRDKVTGPGASQGVAGSGTVRQDQMDTGRVTQPAGQCCRSMDSLHNRQKSAAGQYPREIASERLLNKRCAKYIALFVWKMDDRLHT